MFLVVKEAETPRSPLQVVFSNIAKILFPSQCKNKNRIHQLSI